jgi:hypothetical protein
MSERTDSEASSPAPKLSSVDKVSSLDDIALDGLDAPSGEGRMVLVTGAASYVGSHVVDCLLRQGYRGEASSLSPLSTPLSPLCMPLTRMSAIPTPAVRGTARNPASHKCAHLHAMKAQGLPLELVAADLLDAASWEVSDRCTLREGFSAPCPRVVSPPSARAASGLVRLIIIIIIIIMRPRRSASSLWRPASSWC